MLKGLTLTPPVIGRISIGKVVERGGKRLPEKDDEFTLTSQVQHKDGWVAHPLDEVLRQANPGAKLRAIPVRLLFDEPDLNLRANYSLFDRHTGRPMCVGDGQACRRVTTTGMQALPCPSPDSCEAANGQCKPFGRLNVRIDICATSNAQGVQTNASGRGEEDTLGSFIFRTPGFNSIRTLATRLRYFHAASNGRLSTLALDLKLRGKSTAQSHRSPIYYVDLAPRAGLSLTEAISQAQSEWDERHAAGFNQTALDEAARTGLALGAFEESADEAQSVVEEFYPVDPPEDGKAGKAGMASKATTATTATTARRLSASARSQLADKLADKMDANLSLVNEGGAG